MPRRPDPKLHALWRERIQRHSRSGLSIAQFCARERLSAKLFSNWKRRFRLINLAAPQAALPAPPVFVPVTVRVLENARDDLPPIEADLPNGVRLRIPTSNAGLACRVVRTVAAARTDSGGST